MDNTCDVCGEFLNAEGNCNNGCEEFSEADKATDTTKIERPTQKSAEKMIECHKCGSENHWYRTYCDKCKINLEDAISQKNGKSIHGQRIQVSLETCQNCNHQFSTRASLCPKCNKERTAKCFVCKKQINQSSKSCPECGDPEPFEQHFSDKHISTGIIKSKEWSISNTSSYLPETENDKQFTEQGNLSDRSIHSVNPCGRNIYRRPYEWYVVINWILTLFLFGLITPNRYFHSGMYRFATSLMIGITIAIFGGLIVAIWKYFKRTQSKEIAKEIETNKAIDHALFFSALMIAILIIGKSIYFENYASFIDAAILFVLGFAIRANLHLARWLYAIYAFVTPILVIANDGGNAVVWPFVFYLACRSLYSQKAGEINSGYG